MDLVHSTYPEAEPTGFFPRENLQGAFPAARAQSDPATVLRDSLHSSHTISATSCVGTPKTPQVVSGMKTRKKAQFYRALAPPDPIDRRSSNRPKPILGSPGSHGHFRRALWNSLASWDPRKTADRPAVKIQPGHQPHENPSKYVQMPASAPAVRNWCCLLWNVVIQYRLRFVLLNQSVQNSASA
jgi:hypothetical protein